MLLSEDKEVDIFVASRIGSFKHIKYHTDSTKNSKKNIENLVDIKTLQKDECITRLEWGNAEQTEILVGRKNQQIQIYNTLQGFTKTYTADFAPGAVVGLGRSKRKLLAAVSSGVVKIWSKKTEELVNVGKLDRMRVCADDDTLFATGGEENDLKIWRIGEPTATFEAKNLAHDWLQLRRPVWVSDLVFLGGEGGNLVAVCSRHGYVRLYDSRAQRRPVINVDFENMAATCITNSFDERQVLVGFGRGQLHQVDLRAGKPHKGYKGCTGAVTDLAIVRAEGRTGRRVVSCSLDRHVRLHEYDSKELVYKQYLTSKLSCVLVQTENSTPLTKREKEIKEEEEDIKVETEGDDLDTLFEKMETVGDKPKKQKKQLILSAEEIEPSEVPAKKIRPSTGGTTDSTVVHTDSPVVTDSAAVDTDSPVDTDRKVFTKEDAIMMLLRSTERTKRRREERRREKKAKSVFHNA